MHGRYGKNHPCMVDTEKNHPCMVDTKKKIAHQGDFFVFACIYQIFVVNLQANLR